MYKITQTRYTRKDGTRKFDVTPKVVEDLEEYRKELMSPEYDHINFAYETLSDDVGKDTED